MAISGAKTETVNNIISSIFSIKSPKLIINLMKLLFRVRNMFRLPAGWFPALDVGSKTQTMEATNGSTLTANDHVDQRSTFSGLDNAANDELSKLQAKIVEKQKDQFENQGTKSAPNLGLGSTIRRMSWFGGVEEKMPEANKGRRVSISMSFH